MKNIIVMLVVVYGLISCNNESIKIEGKLYHIADGYLTVKIRSIRGDVEKVIDTLEVNKGEFEFYTDSLKPPVKLCFQYTDSSSFTIWVGEYGKKFVEVNKENDLKVDVLGSFFYDELIRVQGIYDEMYFEPIKDKIEELRILNIRLDNGEELADDEDKLKLCLEQDLKAAKRLRKKSILKTVRKNPSNPVSMGLLYEECLVLNNCHRFIGLN